MDPFEVRIQFLNLLKRLNATQQSIQKVVGYALKYFSRCGDDLWECVVEECQKGSLNMRINILYMLDNLCESSLMHQSQTNSAGSSQGQAGSYVQYITRDLHTIVQLVVPDTRDGLVNLMSARQILDSWKSKRVLDPTVVDDVVQTLDHRRESLHLAASSDQAQTSHSSEFSKDEVVKRFEEDRERHKLLRQKRWHVPVPAQSASSQASQSILPRLSSALSLPPPQPTDATITASSSTGNINNASSSSSTTAHESALDIEFDNAWETTSDWNEDDDEAIMEENILCFGRPFSASRPASPERMSLDPRPSRFSYQNGHDQDPRGMPTGFLPPPPPPPVIAAIAAVPPNRSHHNQNTFETSYPPIVPSAPGPFVTPEQRIDPAKYFQDSNGRLLRVKPYYDPDNWYDAGPPKGWVYGQAPGGPDPRRNPNNWWDDRDGKGSTYIGPGADVLSLN